jgi:hypothetical protein
MHASHAYTSTLNPEPTTHITCAAPTTLQQTATLGSEKLSKLNVVMNTALKERKLKTGYTRYRRPEEDEADSAAAAFVWSSFPALKLQLSATAA